MSDASIQTINLFTEQPPEHHPGLSDQRAKEAVRHCHQALPDRRQQRLDGPMARNDLCDHLHQQMQASMAKDAKRPHARDLIEEMT